MLSGVRLIEVAGVGPGPFCGMLFADLGADVILVERREIDPTSVDFGEASLLNRGKRSLTLDLKAAEDVQTFMQLVQSADAVIEGFRPGVMERLGVGPEACHKANPRLVYGRATGWGQTGPMSHMAGHDHNYAALSGALWYGGMAGTPPYTPPTLVGDVAGGALYLVIGLLTGIVKARQGGQGCVVDAAIFDANAHMMSLVLMLQQLDLLRIPRGTSPLDGAHWSRAYRCACGGYVSVQTIEPKFYRIFLERLGLSEVPLLAKQYEASLWPEQTAYLERLFLTRSRDAWCAVFGDADACFAPVLNPQEVLTHPHNKARSAYLEVDGVLQAAPAPRFSIGAQWQAKASPRRNEHEREIRASLSADIAARAPTT